MNPIDYKAYTDLPSPAQGLGDLAAPAGSRSDTGVDGNRQQSTFAEAVNAAATSDRSQKVENSKKTEAKEKVQATDRTDRTSDIQATGTDQVASAEGTKSQDYVAAYGALVPADNSAHAKTGGALTHTSDTKPDHEVSGTLGGDSAALSAAAITVQLGAGEVKFQKQATDAVTGTDGTAKTDDSHLLPIDELSALLEGKAPAQAGQAADDAAKAAAPADAAAKAAAQAQAQQPAKAAAAEAHDKNAAGTAVAAAQIAANAAAHPAGAQGLETALAAVTGDSTPATAAAQTGTAQAKGQTGQPDASAATLGKIIATDGTQPAGTVAADGTQAPDTADKVPPLLAEKPGDADAKAQAAAAHAAAAKAATHQAAQAQQVKNVAEGHAVATQQQAATSHAAAKAAAADTPDGKTTDAGDFKALLQNGNAQAVGPQLTARAIDPTAGMGQQMASGQGRDPSLALTPEQLVGQTASGAHDAVAGGLSNLRGQPSFMDSMGLMGGRPSATLVANVAQQFGMQVSKAVMAGEQQFTVRLNPTDLGQVQVKLHFTKDGEVRAKVAAEHPETLQLLQRDAKGLEKALTSSGHKVDQGGISFSLDNSNQESAGRAFAEAVQQEKMRADLAARSASTPAMFMETAEEQQVPLENILPHVNASTGVDISV